jgi:hypothetical protein
MDNDPSGAKLMGGICFFILLFFFLCEALNPDHDYSLDCSATAVWQACRHVDN